MSKPPDKFDDRYHKQLFSHPQMVEELITSFVKGDWIKQVDFTTLEKLSETYVDDDYSQREMDIIYKASFQNKKEVYFYILIEFQSTVDNLMALRVVHYIILFYRYLVKQGKVKQKKFPFVYPIVLYNGDTLWNAPENMSELIEVPEESLREHIINFKYDLISVNTMSMDELIEIKNAVSALFYMEKFDTDTLQNACDLVVDIIYSLSNNELQIDLSRWLSFFLNKQKVLEDVDITKLNKSEVTTMLTTAFKRYEEKLIEKGIEKGQIANKKEIIFRVAHKRFSNVPTDFESKINAINDLALLDAIIDTVIDAKNFADVDKLL